MNQILTYGVVGLVGLYLVFAGVYFVRSLAAVKAQYGTINIFAIARDAINDRRAFFGQEKTNVSLSNVVVPVIALVLIGWLLTGCAEEDTPETRCAYYDQDGGRQECDEVKSELVDEGNNFNPPQPEPECMTCLEAMTSADKSLPLCSLSASDYVASQQCLCMGPCALWCGSSSFCGGDFNTIECDTCALNTVNGCSHVFNACMSN